MTEDECIHDWCYANFIYTSNPPLHPKICRKCGKQELERGKTYRDEYAELKEKFQGK